MLRDEQERRYTHIKQRLRETKYSSEQMRQDWEAALAVAELHADNPQEWRARLLDHFMTRIRAGLALGVELPKRTPPEEEGPV